MTALFHERTATLLKGPEGLVSFNGADDLEDVPLTLGTRHVVADVVAGGASTSKEVAEACGAGADCGRCRRTVRAIIAAAAQVNAGAAC